MMSGRQAAAWRRGDVLASDAGDGLEQPGIDDKVAFLERPDSYPETTGAVEVVETHMSWIFLTDAHAYKLKKPVRYAFLDFTSLDRRLDDCQEEVQLNRRLAGDVYLGLVALRQGRDGGLYLDAQARDGDVAKDRDAGSGQVADWLVKMKRLPADRALDQAIHDGTVTDADLRAVAMVLSRFYHDRAPVPTHPAAYLRRLADQARVNAHELGRRDFALPLDRVRRIRDAQLDFLADHGDLVEARARADRIVEAHGDLRPEHVYLGPEPAIMDCLEFRRDFRILDSADELAFLAMECDRLDLRRAGRIFYEVYGEVTGDRPPAALIAFYKSLRASLRAKLAIWHLKDTDPRDGAKWRGQALSYLELAGSYVGDMA